MKEELSIGGINPANKQPTCTLFIYNENTSAGREQTNLFVFPHLFSELHNSRTGKRRRKLFAAAAVAGEVQMSRLAVVVPPGSEREGPDLPHQPGARYSRAARDPEEG